MEDTICEDCKKKLDKEYGYYAIQRDSKRVVLCVPCKTNNKK